MINSEINAVLPAIFYVSCQIGLEAASDSQELSRGVVSR